MIDGKTLIQWGFEPAPWFKQGIAHAQKLDAKGIDHAVIFELLQEFVPETMKHRTNGIPYGSFIEPEGEVERKNVAMVHEAMDKLMRVPTIEAGAIMPDACPAGTIPVGGVVAAKNAIHPGFHSADICCSMALTVFKRDEDPKRVLDSVQKYVHFGPSKRESFPTEVSGGLLARMEMNPFLKDLQTSAFYHFTTQGDGNHFYFVGQLESTGQVAIVSHHGSRGLGTRLYKKGMAAAKRHTRIVAERVPQACTWLDSESDDGRAYWDALQLVRQWTKDNHFAIHDLVARDIGNKIVDRFWNEHNFVFRKSDGLYYHAKGATPSYKGFSPDDDGRTLIPMNMAEPIIISEHAANKGALEFAPHGAGRNMSRTQLLRTSEPTYPEGIDVRFFCGKPDLSELPAAYKSAASVQAQIEKFGLAKIVDRVLPYGSIMAGDWEQDAPWRKR